MHNSLSDSYIYLEKQRVSRKQIVPCKVYFNLNEASLAQIEQAQKDDYQIVFSANKLANLRYYALLSSYLATDSLVPQEYWLCSSQLIFATNYLQDTSSITMVESAISIEGKISQQIRRDILQNPQLFRRIIKAHHWSILQILTQLPLKSPWYANELFWILSLLITIAIAPLILYFIPISYWFKIIAIIIFFFILRIRVKYLFSPGLKSWIVQQLLFGFLASKVKKRHLGFKVLSIFN